MKAADGEERAADRHRAQQETVSWGRRTQFELRPGRFGSLSYDNGMSALTSACGGKSGPDMLIMSLAAHDPERSIGVQVRCAAQRGIPMC